MHLHIPEATKHLQGVHGQTNPARHGADVSPAPLPTPCFSLQVECDEVPQLAEYVGKSMPVFLFYKVATHSGAQLAPP